MEIGFITFLVVSTVQGLIFSAIIKDLLNWKSWKIYGPIQMLRTKTGLKFIDKTAKKYPRFWRAYGNFGIILAFGVLGGLYVFRKKRWFERIILSLLSSLFIISPMISSYLLGSSSLPGIGQSALTYFIGYGPTIAIISVQTGVDTLIKMVYHQPVVAKAGPVIPGVDIKGSPFRGVPWYGWLTFPILLIVHEFSHGFLARIGKIKLKSTGVLLMGVLPLGAFVEPDEKQIEKAKPETTLPLFAAGSTANYITAFIFLMFAGLVMAPLMQVTGVSSTYTHYLDYPMVAASVNPDISYGAKIIAINNIPIHNIQDIHAITHNLGPNANVTLNTSSGLIHTHLNGNSLLGVYLSQDYKNLPVGLSLLYHFNTFIGLVVFFNFMIGLMNLLPILPLDGGLMMQDFIWKVFKVKERRARQISVGISIILGVGLLLNLLPIVFQF